MGIKPVQERPDPFRDAQPVGQTVCSAMHMGGRTMINTPHQGIGPHNASLVSDSDTVLNRDETIGDWGSGCNRVSDPLTARERDVLAMISQGLSNKRVARVLEISPETVKSHVKHIFLKLVVSNRAEAVSRAGSLGLLPYGEPTPTASHDKCDRSIVVWYRRSISTE
jgi:DNA-binding CsgD family transcriptional regulator